MSAVSLPTVVNIHYPLTPTSGTRMYAEWRGTGRSPEAAMKAHAVRHGFALGVRANASARMYWVDAGGRLRQRTLRRVSLRVHQQLVQEVA